jgi:chromate transporter
MSEASRPQPPSIEQKYQTQARYGLLELIRYMLWLGTSGFGGPVALVGYMYRDLVEKRSWFTNVEYKEGLTLSQIAPGPLAAQLAIYLGFCHYGLLGASLAGFAFVIPSFLMVVVLGWVYVRFGELPWLQATFYGVGASIIGIIARSAQKLTVKTVGKDYLMWAIFGVVAVNTVWIEQESIPLIAYAGLLLWAVRRGRASAVANGAGAVPIARQLPLLLPVSAGGAFLLVYAFVPQTAEGLFPGWSVSFGESAGGSGGVLWDIFWYFGAAGTFVFGSGLAIVPFLFGGVVKEFHWLTDQQFLDAVAVALITPGPVVITTGFIGYLVAGLAGACVAAFATFFPCYLFTVIPAPLMRKYGTHPAIIAAVDGVTAATAGAIAGAVIVLGKRSVVDLPTAGIALATYLVLAKTSKIPEPVLVMLSAAAGLAMYPLVR